MNPTPTEVQTDGIGAPQAHWLSLAHRGVQVSATPTNPRPVFVRFHANQHVALTVVEAYRLAADITAAAEWEAKP